MRKNEKEGGQEKRNAGDVMRTNIVKKNLCTTNYITKDRIRKKSNNKNERTK